MQELKNSLAHHSRFGQRRCDRRADPPRVAEGATTADTAALVDDHVGAAASELPRTREANYATADDHDFHGRQATSRVPHRPNALDARRLPSVFGLRGGSPLPAPSN